MSGVFFQEFGIQPDITLERDVVAVTSAQIRNLVKTAKPCAVVVYGDTNATLAGALGAEGLAPIIHVEAGLRAYDMSLPEELNRIVVDHRSEFLFTSCAEAEENLHAEGLGHKRIYPVGNIMIDTLVWRQNRILPRREGQQTYGVLTIHRPFNADNPRRMETILTESGARWGVPVKFVAHPRHSVHKLPENVERLEPMGYTEFLSLVNSAAYVVTDSGGLQEETSYLGIPCITVRPNTERPVTVRMGTNILTEPENIMLHVQEALGRPKPIQPIPQWDGKTAERIRRILIEEM